MKKLYLLLQIFGMLMVASTVKAQLGCITRSITSNPNIGTAGAPNYLVGVDANNCPVTRPTANYIAISLCNTCPSPVYVGNISYVGTNLPGVELANNQVSTQEVGILAAGQCKTIYYHLGWPCNPGNNDVPFTLTFQLNDSVNTSNMTFNFTKRKLIDANAGGLVTGYTVMNANVVGGFTTLTATYEFGNLPATGAVIAYHPLSDTNFNSMCYQLVKSEVIATNLAACIPLGYDLMAYVPPGGNGNVCDNAAITVKYYFKANCPGVSTSLTPMTYATSGGEIKKRIGLTNGGSIGFGSGAVVPSISKTVNKTNAAPGDTLTYSIQLCNPSLTDSTSIDQLVDVLPAGFVYAGMTPASTVVPADFTAAPGMGATGTLQFKAGVLTPGLYKTIVLPPNSCKTLVYKVAIPITYTNYGVRNNAAVYKIGIYTSDTAKASVYVNKNIATPDINQTIMNMPVSGSVATNDILLPSRTFSVIGSMSNGALVFNANGTYTYTPNLNFRGRDSISYVVCTGATTHLCDTASLTIEVSHTYTNLVNETLAQDDIATTLMGSPVVVCVRCNDSDPNGNTLSNPTITANPANGNVVVNGNGTITYTPNANFRGRDFFSYSVCDNGAPLTCNTAHAFVEVLPFTSYGNQTIANDDAIMTSLNTPVSSNVSSNDTDPQGNGIAFVKLSNPLNGTVVFNANGSYTYTPNTGYIGPDQFVYRKYDNGTPVANDTATVYISINRPYLNAYPDINTTLMGFPVGGSVATNDNVPAGSVFSLLGSMSNGSLVFNANGTYTYTPNANFVGQDSVRYVVCMPAPAALCDTTTLVIQVTPLYANQDNAVIANDDNATTVLNTPVTICIKCNDFDPNGNTIGMPVLLSNPAQGAVALQPNGSVIFTPANGFSGSVQFRYGICDNGLPIACDSANVFVEVLPITTTVNQTFANDDANTTLVNTPVNGNVSLNDTDPQGDAVTFTTLSIPAHGTLVFNANGTYTYTPTSEYYGPDQFVYRKCDNGIPSACDTATVYLTVNRLFFETNPDFNVTLVNISVSGNVQTNDAVPAGTTYGAATVIAGNPGPAIPTMNANGTYTFVSAVQGVFQFLVPVCIPSPATCRNELLTITVLPMGGLYPPIANTDIATTQMNTAVTLASLSNDMAALGYSLNPASVTLVEGPAHGTAVVNPLNGNITYTPAAGYLGKDTLTYQVCQNTSPVTCATAKQIITVIPVSLNNSTTAADDMALTPLNTSASGNVLTNDNDPQGNTQTVTPQTTTIPGVGTLVLNANGTYTFTPVTGFSGPVEFSYTVCDNGIPQACTQATLHILISALQAPLPVLMNHFEVNTVDCQVNLNWSTAQESNVSHFDVERLNGAQFEMIGAVPSKGGNFLTNYQYADGNAGRGVQTYRLKMVDIDGKFSYSEARSVNVSCSEIRLYPNPAALQTNLSISSAEELTYDIRLVDAVGKLIYRTSLELKNETKVLSLPVENLAEGIYSVLVSDGSQLKVIRFRKTSK